VLPKGFEQTERYSQGPVLRVIHPEPRVNQRDPLFLPHIIHSLASEIEARTTPSPIDRSDQMTAREV